MTAAVFVCESDVRRLRDLVDLADLFPWCDRQNLENLDRTLARAEIVSPQQLPNDRVAMHSRVQVTDLGTGERTCYILVFPSEANFFEHKISVLAPIGASLLGARIGTVIKVETPGGKKKLHIDEVEHQAGLAQSAA